MNNNVIWPNSFEELVYYSNDLSLSLILIHPRRKLSKLHFNHFVSD